MDIDGSLGEGGGQILRTALALALITGTPIRVEKIRAGRRKPGLMRQHLVAVRAAAQIGAAKVSGDELGSTALSFAPTDVRGGTHHFKIGSAGSTTLVLQTVLPALLRAREPSRLIIEGGTHNPLAPTFDFLERSFLPVLRRMGARVELALESHGFHPAGGGRIVATIEPSALVPLDLTERGAIVSRSATAVISALPGDVAERELARVRERLGFTPPECHIRGVKSPTGPGNVLSIALESTHVTELVTAFGERGLRAESVADKACDEIERYLSMDGVPVGEHLADQLLLPLALAGGGRFRAVEASSHARTQVELIPRFLDRIAIDVTGDGVAAFEVRSRDSCYSRRDLSNPFDAGEAAPSPPLEDARYPAHLRAPYEAARRTLTWMIFGYLVSGFTVASVTGGDMLLELVFAAVQLALRRWSSASLRPAVYASAALFALSLVIVALLEPTSLFVDLPVRVIMAVMIVRALLISPESLD